MDNLESFDTLMGALTRIDMLRDAKQTAYLKHELVSAVYDSRGRIESAVYTWMVARSKTVNAIGTCPVEMRTEGGIAG